ncbi:uncharacterized protein LOC105253222 [Camponotus floridanus]|uniref:uncharacterized protein LOC105253222 n=1 Tax=Camponotus floridanus TaxID=104421 RepID=UPI00059E09D5|nr:uncharacterized protein LOC105253222 [Camponotus floridanus]XP_011259402.1 uncharacterized protein LOC105253222 [Camponotus floridanus]
MDNLVEPTPPKKRCVVENENKMQLIECVREFRLSQQFPSTLKQAVKQDIVNSIESPSSMLTMPKKITLLSSVESNRKISINKLQKLRILSPKGKDLGEFNVELRNDNLLKGKTIMITKSNTLRPVKKPVTVTLSSVSEKLFPRILKQGTVRISKNNLMNIKSYSKNESETNKSNVLEHCTTLSKNKMIGNQDIKTEGKEAQVFNDIVDIPVSMSETNSKQDLYQIIDINNQKYIVCNKISSKNSHVKIPKIKITEDSEATSAVKVLPHKEIIESSFSTVNLKHAINSDSNNIHRSEECSKNTVLTQEHDTVSSASEKDIIHHGKILCDIKCENIQNKYDLKKGSGNNCSTVKVDDPMQCIPELQQITSTTDTIMQLNVENQDHVNDSVQSGLSDQWDIIKKAMDSVRDNKLRALALKALADCGIGIERHVPIRLPEEHKAVHDTQVQTMVFGLLDPKSFIFINKDLDNIQRVNQITLCDMPNQDQSVTNGLYFNDSVFKAPVTTEQESDFDLDNFIKQIVEENSDTVKMKETLSMTKIRCKNLIKHLERDFESVKCYDQNGMLNIHNAVISNNIHFVQRQLMVLQQCKESVDILTENGMTSLELAIKYDAHDEIVKLLLKAGAQPVIPKYIHESALIIASKQSSSLLSMLIEHVSDSKLLDQIDSEGFAALHYCCIRNNLEGVKALLSAGATTDLKDMRSGRTPLFHALDNNHTTLVQTLVKAGAVANIMNYAGQTPLPVVAGKFIFQNIRKETT